MKLVKYRGSSADSITVHIPTDGGVYPWPDRATVTGTNLDCCKRGNKIKALVVCQDYTIPDWTEAPKQPYRYSLYKVMFYKKQIQDPFIPSYKHYILSIYT